MILSAMKLGLLVASSQMISRGKSNSPKLVLMPLEALQRLLKDTSNRTPAHLDPDVLAIRLVASPRDLAVMHTDRTD